MGGRKMGIQNRGLGVLAASWLSCRFVCHCLGLWVPLYQMWFLFHCSSSRNNVIETVTYYSRMPEFNPSA